MGNAHPVPHCSIFVMFSWSRLLSHATSSCLRDQKGESAIARAIGTGQHRPGFTHVASLVTAPCSRVLLRAWCLRRGRGSGRGEIARGGVTKPERWARAGPAAMEEASEETDWRGCARQDGLARTRGSKEERAGRQRSRGSPGSRGRATGLSCADSCCLLGTKKKTASEAPRSGPLSNQRWGFVLSGPKEPPRR